MVLPGNRAATQEADDEDVTLDTLPNDILGKIIRETTFRDKCSLELLNKQFHTLLSNPLSTEGLWGSCNLIHDLKLVDNFGSKEDIMRWLFKRLPGFTSLICDTKCPFLYHWLRNDVLVEDRTEAMEAITWFVTQLPMIAKASASKMDLRITSDVSPMLLNLSTIDDNTYLFGRGHRVHDGFWDALSESLVELSIEMHAPYVFRQDDIAKRWTSVFNKLTNLTSLKVCGSQTGSIWYDTTCVLDLPRLRNLHISQLSTSNLTLKCPVLRSLTLQRCTITDPFSLDAPLEHLACKGDVNLCVHEAFPPSNFLGLKSLRLHLWRETYQLIPDQINGLLRYMSMLRTVELVFNRGGLPLQLPASLQSLSYYLERYWGPGDLERFADTCRLPHLQSINPVHRNKWKPHDQLALQKIAAEGKGKATSKSKGKGKGKGKVSVTMKNGETFEL